jgi:hypothetical protein
LSIKPRKENSRRENEKKKHLKEILEREEKNK